MDNPPQSLIQKRGHPRKRSWARARDTSSSGADLSEEGERQRITSVTDQGSWPPCVCVCVYVCAKSLQLCPTLCDPIALTVASQTPLSTGFSRQEYWSGLPCSPPGDLPNPEIKPTSLMPPALIGRQVLYHQCHMESPLTSLINRN